MQSPAQWLATFWQNPRKTFLRKSMFQVHLWTGIAVGLLSTVIGISGSAIVYKDSLEHLLSPSLFATKAQPRLSADDLVRRARNVHPGWSIQYIEVNQSRAEENPEPWVFYMSPPTAKAPGEHLLYLDPSTGAVLGEQGRSAGILNWLAELHYRLLAGETGTKINGIGAILLFLLCLTGIIIWWPGRKRWRSGLHINWKARGTRFNWDLHNVLGFWLTLPLAVEAFTGIYYCFFLPMATALVILLGGNVREAQNFLAPPQSAVRQNAASVPLEPLIQESLRTHQDCTFRGFQVPERPMSPVLVYLSPPHAEDRGQYARMAFDRYTGKVLGDVDSRQASFAIRTLLFFGPLHFGTFAGHTSKIAWILLGLAPGVLFYTGFLMWWRRVVAKRWKKVRKETAEDVTV